MKVKELRARGRGLKRSWMMPIKSLTCAFQAATKQLKNHREPPRAKEIALFKTIIRERELG